MREILFRGKTAGGEWIEGFPMIFTDNFVQMCNPFIHNKTVYPETIGQYTGLTDKNGNKIFEGDIVKGAWNTRLVIYYDDCYLQFRAKEKSGLHNDVDYYGLNRIEVIGNIHDNPELLNFEGVHND